ncbi:RadC family protein [Robertkochia solimangrovi]|uniref:RadC family protein n=1 Tax=Robertkochia solimangrovi TaxID=2213046 RepID=UPI0011808291|nr:DNA repair protein RadC [Robertkochia solimangrovi]TRZ44250.1 hypothetical protein DMZ48_06975 [Robertkochia solimangrovi]
MQYPDNAFSIKHWSEEDRPREKLLKKGRSSLSDAELLAILIGSGSSGESAVALSKRMLAGANNNLNEFARATMKHLTSYKGIGQAKALVISAAMELGRRRNREELLVKHKIINSESAFRWLQPLIGELLHEEFWVIYLNNSNRITETFQLSKGGMTGTLVDIRLLLKKALECNATSMIIAHNHPSGTLLPSSADKQLTQKIRTASVSLDINLIDHLIVTEKDYFSFADEGLL